MSKFISKRSALLAAAAVLCMTAGAVAYWTSSGSGSGTGSVGSQDGTVTLSGSAPQFTKLEETQQVTVKAANSSSSSTKVGTVKIDEITSDKPGCNSTDQPDWFTHAAVVQDERIAAGATAETLDDTIPVRLEDVNENQDACQGANLTFVLSSTAGTN